MDAVVKCTHKQIHILHLIQYTGSVFRLFVSYTNLHQFYVSFIVFDASQAPAFTHPASPKVRPHTMLADMATHIAAPFLSLQRQQHKNQHTGSRCHQKDAPVVLGALA